MKAIITTKGLKELHSTLKDTVDEVRLRFASDGVHVLAVDDTEVSLISLHVTPKAFSTYEVEEPVNICIDLDKLEKFLKVPESDANIEMSYNAEKNTLVLKAGNVRRTLALLNEDRVKGVKVPNLNLPAQVSFPAEEFKRAVKASEAVNDAVHFLVHADGFRMSAIGISETLELDFTKEECGVFVNDTSASKEPSKGTRSLYAQDYLARAAKTMGQTVTVSFGTDYPCILDYDVMDGNGTARFLLAPRIESE